MDYTTLPHRLIYNPRFSLKDFGVYKNHPINALFAESMLQLDLIQGNYSEKKVLRCLNNAYYITTMVLLEEDPRWRMGSYQKLIKAGISDSPDAFDLFSFSLVSAYLRALANDLTPLQKSFSDNLYNYVSNHYLLVKYPIDSWMLPRVKLPRKEFAPRFINKAVFNDLENDSFMWAEYTDEYNEYIVRDLIYGLGETGEEKFTLLFEIDKDAQAFYDRNSYYQDVVKEMLGKICDELCEKYNNHENCVIHFDSEKDEEEDKDNKEQIIEDLNSEVENLQGENTRLKSKNDELRQRLAERGDESTEWVGCFDLFFHNSLNPQAIANALNNINHPYFPKNERGYWWVFVNVLVEIGWIPKTNYKMTLQWANLHFKCGWDWARDNQFKFNDINENIRAVQPSSKWDKTVTGNVIGDYYGALAKSMKEAFTIIVNDGKLMDRKEFIKPGCPLINNGRK